MAAAVLAVAAPSPAVSGDAADIVPATNIDSAQTDGRAISLIDTFRILRDRDHARRPFGPDPSDINFLFASGRGYIVDRRATRPALPMFPRARRRRSSRCR